MQEYTINEFVTLNLEDGKTNIYVLGEEFIQCKYLLMNIPVERMNYLDEINSIDEAAEKLDNSLDLGNPDGYNFRKEIPPEVEFWGHCSNLQVWSEQDYDTRFIHSNLAFPLLKKLTEVGDPKAERVFKDEIGKRFENGPDSVRQYLALEGYMDYLSREEMWSVISNQSEVKILRAIEREVGVEFRLGSDEMDELVWDELVLGDNTVRKLNPLGFSIKDGLVNRIEFLNFKTLSAQKLKKLFRIFGKLTGLKELNLSRNSLKKIPDNINELRCLKVLKLSHNEVEELPETIGDLKKLKWLILSNNKIKELPESIGDLEELKWLILSDNKIKKLPESIGRLRLLEDLKISNNHLVELPDSIGNLKSVAKLFIKNNRLKNLPDTIIGMGSLRNLGLTGNLLSDLPKKMVEMKSLKILFLVDNKINGSSPVIASLKKKGVIVITEKKI